MQILAAGLLYGLAAVAEIAGCFAVWAVWRLGASPVWLLPGTASLFLFAGLLALAPADAAGRAFAAYGGVYIAASLAWLRLVEGRIPDRFDLAGGSLAVIGAAIILFAPRSGG